MADHDLQRIETIFQDAADLAASERAAFLARECDGDDDLRGRVEALLERLDSDDSFTAPVGSAPGGPMLAAAITEGPGSVIGRYKLLQVIGEGGFGVVYMAEQQEPVVRKVALKIIKLGMDTREVVARFEAERQALAMMDHPNISRVLDGGATNSGRPYFVMELVRGVAITHYCDKNDMSTLERLELFEQVCHAVQHAHQKGVIHRDIKPSNVLVTLNDGEPMPKIIDFGVAKAIHTRLTEKTLFTRYEQFIGTPAYMSPEQAEMSALDVDTRTDIYALGVLLYELLTGTTPFDEDTLRRAGLAEIQRIIREQQPPRPSLRISTGGDAKIARHRGLDVAGLSRSLRGDLDWIVMKALDKDRSRRYATASELAEDIRRHVRNEPVLASPPGAAYRTRKFLSRNRAAVLSAALVGIALVAGIIGTSIGMMRADRSAAMAKREAAHALAALEFLDSTLALTDPEVSLDPTLTVRALLDHTAGRVSEAFAEQPWAEVRMRSTIGRAYASMSEYELAEAHLRRAVDLVEELMAEDGAGGDLPGETAYGPIEYYAALWTLVNVCFHLDRPDAFAVSRRADRVGRQTIAVTHPELADAISEFIAAVERNAWSLDPDAMQAAPALFETASTLADETLAPDDERWEIVANMFLGAGYMVWYTPHEPMAELFWGKALEIQGRVLPPDHPDIATSINLVVGILNKQGRAAEAEDLIRSSIEALRRVHREGALPIAIAESTLGENLIAQGRFEEAEPPLLRSHEIILAKVKEETNYMALESFARVVDLYDAWDRPVSAKPYRESLARICIASKYVQQWRVARRAFGPEHRTLVDLGDRVNELCGGVNYLATPGTGTAPELVQLLRELTATRAALVPNDDLRAAVVGRVLIGWANALDPEKEAEARRLIGAEARRILEARSTELGVDLAEALALLANAARVDGDAEEARRLALEAWRILSAAPTRVMWFTTAAQIRVARSLLASGLYHEAESVLLHGHETMTAQLGGEHADRFVTRSLLYELYIAWGRPEEARAFAPVSSAPEG